MRKPPLFSLVGLAVWTFVLAAEASPNSEDGQPKFSDTFEEELVIRPLENGYVHSHFQFTTKWDVDVNGNDSYCHYRLFPKSLGEILEKYDVEELHLSLTQGLWKYPLWGYPVVGAPPGAQLWVWFKKDTKDVDGSWLDLCNALSGLFCTSLNFIDATNTISPSLSFRPRGIAAAHHSDPAFLRYASVPREIVCTENLTPWKKLLPCTAVAGIAALINGREIFNTHYNSLGIHVRQVCLDSKCTQPALEFSQTLSLVSELPEPLRNKPDWSLKKLYGSILFRSCPVATRSFIYVDLSQNVSGTNPFVLSPPPMEIHRNGRNVQLASYDVKRFVEENNPANIAAIYEHNLNYGVVRPPVLHVNRYIKENGRWSGIVHCRIHHTRSKRPLKIVYLEQIPYFARVYAHTFRIESNGRRLEPERLLVGERRGDNRPFVLEAVITLPPNSVTEITLHFEKAFLKWNLYPPDANHGFYLGPAVVSAAVPSSDNHTLVPQDLSGIHPELHGAADAYFIRIYTEVLLLALPTPDFSMPYNVICLVCTVVAFAFGPLHNVTTKRLTIVAPKKKKGFLNLW